MARPLATIRRIRERIGSRDALPVERSLPASDWERIRRHLADALGRHDQTVRRTRAGDVAEAYERLDDVGRRAFFVGLSRDFGADPVAVHAAAERLLEQPDDLSLRAPAERALREALTPKYAQLFHLLTALQDGVKFLVDLRADLRRLLRDDEETRMLDLELFGHLSTLFDVGLLDLRRITWASPANLLEKLIEYEAVHEIDGWEDLRNRLDTDRRCYAFFHPAMPGEPLVFVEIALTKGAADRLLPLLDPGVAVTDPAMADTAVFYSITSCQAGLAGINLGNELLKHVVDELRVELPHLQQFVTLSPIPTLRSALADTVPEHVRAINEPGPALETARSILEPATAAYLTTLRGGRVADPVANFHLSNGAEVAHVRWMANPNPSGLARSWGLMVNYRYDPDRIEANAEAYATGRRVPAADAVRKLAEKVAAG